MKKFNITVRPAEKNDVKTICELLLIYSKQQIVLARDEADILFYLKNFTVCEVDGVIKGCVALRSFGESLQEVRSLAVLPEYIGYGIGRALVEYVINTKIRPLNRNVRVFALTYQEKFFNKIGFTTVNKELFPEKIWSDCEKCPKKEHCDEIAVMLEIPEVAV